MLTATKIRNADAMIQSRKLAERAFWTLKHGMNFSAAAADGASRDVQRVMRAAVPGATTDDTEALASLKLQSTGFLATLSAVGWFDALLVDMQPAELHRQYGTATSDPSAGITAEGMALRVTRLDFARRILRGQRAGGIVVLSNDVIRHARALDLIERQMGVAVVRTTDARFAAQVVSGQPTISASGHDPAAIAFDIRRALAAVPSGGDAKFRIAMGVDLAKRMALALTSTGASAFPSMSPTGGTIATVPVTVTEALTSNVIVTDATALAGASSDVEIERSTEASLEMANDPTSAANDGASPPAPVGSNLISLFQTSSVALMVTREFDFVPLRSVHSAVITGAGALWGLNGTTSPPT
jgi:hypothetical protein